MVYCLPTALYHLLKKKTTTKFDILQKIIVNQTVPILDDYSIYTNIYVAFLYYFK